MSPEHNAVQESDEGLSAALVACLEALDAGRPPHRQELLARYPQHAAELARFLDDQEQVDRCAAPLRALGVGGEPAGGAPERLGDFRIVREVGRGGMGIVYEAEQVSLRRRVALKVLPLAGMLDPRQRQRFRNEAQAAACLHHTSIVPVYFVGEERGVHFYAMQFIDGRPLSEIVRQLRQAEQNKRQGRPGPEKALVSQDRTVAFQPAPGADAPAGATVRAAADDTPLTSEGRRDRDYFRRVAELGVQTAEALDHAHQLDIVHRDVKPANLLLDAGGRLWVTDFGLAQVQHGEAGLTMTGDLVGTLRYMSPEQALAKRVVIDHRTDVYSLGATLYELLTLRPVFRGKDRQELLRQIAFEEPTPPRRLERAVPAELETVVLKALEKSPAGRYATAKELADDLRRWLDDKPIQARRPSLRQVTVKWARRHRPLVGAAAAVLGVAALMLAGGVGWVANDRATRRAVTAAEARKALQESADWLRRRRLPAALSAARRAVGVLPPAGEADPVVRRAAEARLADLELLTRLEDWTWNWDSSKSKEWNHARADRRYGELFRQANLDVDALPAEEVGERIRGTTVAVELAAWLDEWYYSRHRHAPDKDGRWKHLLRVARAADPDGWRTRLRKALEQQDREALAALASQDEAAHLHPRTLLALANFFSTGGKYDEPAASLLRKAQRAHPDDFWLNYNLAHSLTISQPLEALAFFRVAVALRPRSPWAHGRVGNCLARQGRLDEAIVEYREALRLDDGFNEVRSALGAALRSKGDLEGAIVVLKEAVHLNPDLAVAHYTLGNALRDKGRLDEAIAEYRKAIALKPDYPEAHCNLAHVLLDKGQFAEALALGRRGHELGSKDPRWRYPSAQWVKQYERLVELNAKLPAVLGGKEQPANTPERIEYAQVCCKKHLYAAAAGLLREAIAAKSDLMAPTADSVRYNAACFAALAGTGEGEDAARLTDAERAGLRREALDWLRADLSAWRKALEKGPDKARPAVAKMMQVWLADPDFDGVRGAAALAKLPAAERPKWQQLWGEVEALKRRAAGSPAAPRPASPGEGPSTRNRDRSDR